MSAVEDGKDSLVSIITPTFNRRAMVGEMLDSLVSQHYRPIEAIVVDDGSTDSTAEELQGRWDDVSGCTLTIIRQHNAGPAAARNRGLQAAHGELVYFLDSDDLVEKDGLVRLARALEASGSDYALGHILHADRDGNRIWRRDNFAPQVDLQGVVGSNWATHAAIIRRSALDGAGHYLEGLLVGEDTELAWRIVATCGAPALIADIVALRRVHDEGHLSDGLPQAQIGLSTLAKLKAFRGWAVERNAMTPAIAQRALSQLPLALLRLRAARLDKEAGELLELALQLESDGAKPSSSFRAIKALGSGPAARLVGKALPGLRAGVRLGRWAKSLFSG